MQSSRGKKCIVFSPDIISLIKVRCLEKGPIYYAEMQDPLSSNILNRLSALLRLFKIYPFKYTIGIGSKGDGFLNTLFQTATHLTHEYTRSCNEKKLIEAFSNQFLNKHFELFFKKKIYLRIWLILRNTHGLLNNYNVNSTVYIPKNSCEAFVFNQYNPGINHDLKIKYYSKYPGNFLIIFIYFFYSAKKIITNGVKIFNPEIKKYKVMIPIDRSISFPGTFNLFEWWDKKEIKQEEIVLVSLNTKTKNDRLCLQKAREMGFDCISLDARHKIPISQFAFLIKNCILFPLKNFSLLITSSHNNIFLFFLVQFFHWFKFFCSYRINTFILRNSMDDDYQTIICNLFKCSTVTYHASYFGAFDKFKTTYFLVNHLLTWGDSQINQQATPFYAENIHYTGCHALTSIAKKKKEATELQPLHAKSIKKNIIFFDNKILNDASTPEDSFFKFIELMLQCRKIFHHNILYRPKADNPFHETFFKEKTRYEEIKKQFDLAQISLLPREHYDISSVLSMADIVVTNMINTPLMIALMSDIPSFAFVQSTENIYDPIMKKYVNKIIFENKNIFFEELQKTLDKEESTFLSTEEKKKINHYNDTRGLFRLKAIVSGIANHQQLM